MKRAFRIAAALAALVALAGCSGGGGKKAAGGAAKAGDKPPAKTVIRFWHIYDADPQKAALEKAIAAFNEAHKGQIRVDSLGVNFWDYWDKLNVSMAAGEEPEVFVNDLGNVGARADTGILLDIGPRLAKAGMDPERLFYKSTIDMCKLDGKYYALPLEPDVRLLFYNKKILREGGYDPEKPPATWAELMAAAKKLTTYDANGNIDRLGINATVAMSQSYFWTWAWGNGHDFTKDGAIKVDSPEIVRDLVEWKRMIDVYGKARLDKFGGEFGAGAADPFVVQKLAFSIQNNTFYRQLELYGKDLEWGVMEIPYPKARATWSNGLSIEISSRAKDPDAAFEFVSYLLSKDVQVGLAQDVKLLTSNREAAADPRLASDPFWKLCDSAMGVTRFRPFYRESPKWYEHLQKAVEEVEFGKQKPAEALAHAQGLILADVEKYKLTHK